MTNTMKTTVQKMKSLLTETLCSTGETESHLFFSLTVFPYSEEKHGNLFIYSSTHHQYLLCIYHVQISVLCARHE